MITRFILISFIFFSTAILSPAQELPKIAVTAIEYDNVTASEAKILSERLRDELFLTGKFDVLERDRMAPIMNEMELQLSGLTSEQGLSKIGNLLGVEQIVTGSVSRLSGTYHLSIRMIAVSTFRVMKVASEEFRGNFHGLISEVMPKIAEKLAGDENLTELSGDGKQSIGFQVFKVKPKLQVNAKAGYPYYLPNAETDNFQSAYALGFEVLFGRKIYAGLSFDYTKFSEEKQARTRENSLDILGYFTPEVSSQFYALAFYYKSSPSFRERKMAPFAGIKAGIVKRTFDIGLDNYAKVDDNQRLGLSMIIGLEFPIAQFLNLNSSMGYFMTSEKNENDWKPTFNAARTHFSANFGFGFNF